jgi:hypothetical protein
MNDTRVARAGLAPWHLWLVGLLMLVWNAASCHSHVMTLAQDDGYFRASQLAMAVNSVATLLNPEAHEVLGEVGAIGAIAVIALGTFVVLYSMAMKRRGVLR